MIGAARKRIRAFRRRHAGDGDPLARAKRSGRVYLTFDDGPDPEWTPRVLEALSAAGTRATFFVIGEQAALHPEVVKQVSAEGHEVELHCMRHVRHADMTEAETDADTSEAVAVLRSMGIRARRWRPPYGEKAPWTQAVAERHGLTLTGWSSDPKDWLGDDVEAMIERARRDTSEGRVVLMHDGVGPGATRGDCSTTVELIPGIVDLIRSMGLQPAPLGRGPAHWWLRSAPGPRPGAPVELAVIEEDDLGGAGARMVRELLAECITRHRDLYRERGWRRVRPDFRTIATVDSRVIGQQSVFSIATDPPRALFGLGDVVVDPAYRKAGVARSLIGLAVEQARERGAEVILTDTAALESTFRSLGFRPVPRFSLHYEHDGTCRWHPRWLAWGHDDGTRLRLEEGDF